MPKLHPQTGPVTVEGKQASSRNATTHGGTSENLIVQGERREDFDALLNDLLTEYSPATPEAHQLVEDAALARWFLWRKQRAYNAVEATVYSAQPAPALWPPETWHQLSLVDRYKTAAERSLKRALQNLDAHYRAARRAEKEQLQAEVAQARAADFLAQREDSEWQAAFNGFDRPTLVQNITVRTTRYGALTKMEPTNTALLHRLDRPSPYPAEQVCRKFYFPQGIPREYYSFTSREEYRREKQHTIEQPLPIAEWRAIVLAEQAAATGHALPNPENRFVP